MSAVEMNALSTNEKEEIIRAWPPEKLIDGYDFWQATFNPLDNEHCETRDLIRAEIIRRMKESA